VRKLTVVLIAFVALVVGAGVAYATTTNLQSGGTVDHVLVEQWANSGNNLPAGDVGETAVCPEGYYVTGGGYSVGQPDFKPYFNGPVAGWSGLGTAWSAGGTTGAAGTFRVWAVCIELT
jgi:hypothetical protein